MSEPDAQLTEHAKRRCTEMGITPELAKNIWRERSIIRPGTYTSWGTQAYVVTSTNEPRYRIVVVGEGDRLENPIIITIAFATDGPYVRNGGTYTRVSSEEYQEYRRTHYPNSTH